MRIEAKAGQQLLSVSVARHNGAYVVEVDGVRHVVDVRKLEADFYSIVTGSKSYEVSIEARPEGYLVRHGAAERLVTLLDPGRQAREARPQAAGPERVVSVMPGKVVRLLVREGERVEAGQGVVVVEAMKMENEIAASKAGRVASIAVRSGEAVERGAELLVIE